MKYTTKIHGQTATLKATPTKRQWYPVKGETAATPEAHAEVLLKLRFHDSEGDGYCYLRARWGHNHHQRWFVQECRIDNLYASMGCGEVWHFLPEHREHNVEAWSPL